jgi:hypothetical protein
MPANFTNVAPGGCVITTTTAEVWQTLDRSIPDGKFFFKQSPAASGYEPANGVVYRKFEEVMQLLSRMHEPRPSMQHAYMLYPPMQRPCKARYAMQVYFPILERHAIKRGVPIAAKSLQRAFLLFKEFLNIQGGRRRVSGAEPTAEAVSCDFSEDEYTNSQLDTFSGLTAANRVWVFEYYSKYKELRSKRNEWDEAQLANNLMGRVWEQRQRQVRPCPSRPSPKALSKAV